MGKRLVIAEKPSVARDIAAALGGFESQEEYLESDDWIVTWAIGHLLELSEPKDYDPKYASWSIKNLPIIPESFTFKPRNGQKGRLALIKKLGRRKDVVGVVNACDAGREGEMIYRRIVDFTGLDSLPAQRLWLQSMTHASIREAFTELRPGVELDPLADAAWCRAVGDWLIGMNATRALTQRLKSRGEQGAWSAGRVQTPTLNLLVRREREILVHVARPYWELIGEFQYGEQHWFGRYWDAAARSDDREERPGRLFDHDQVERIVAAVHAANHGVASEKRKRSTQSAPGLFDLTGLQREANRKFGFSAKRTLDAAQRLYEGHKALTYPRTDSKHLPDDYGPHIAAVLDHLSADVEYAKLATGIQTAGPLNLDKLLDSKKISDHFAIVPTGQDSDRTMSGDDEKIFDLVVRRFLAALMGPAVWSTLERVVEVDLGEGGNAAFRTTGRMLEVPGHLEALGIPSSDRSNAPAGTGVQLPWLVEGQAEAAGVTVDVDGCEVEAKETQPPARFSEAGLLRAMETAGERVEDEELAEAMRDKGLGTPATRADTIEGLVRKGYARRTQGKLGPTSKAMRLMDVLERVEVPVLASPRLTGEWEHLLAQVQDGTLARDDLQHRLTTFTREVTESIKTFEHDQLYASDPDLGPCPCGQGRVVESAWGYRCTLNTGKDSPCNLMIWKDRSGRFIDRPTAERLVRDGKVGPIPGFFDRYGRELTGTLFLDRDGETGRFSLRTEFGDAAGGADVVEEVTGPLWPCPCGHEGCTVMETSLRYVCKRVLDGVDKKGPVLPRVVCHREMEPEEIAPFFQEESKTAILDGFTSKRGRPFRGALFRKATGKHGFEFPPREAATDKKGKATSDKKPASRKRKTAAETAPTGARKPAARRAATKKKPAAKKKASPGASAAPAAAEPATPTRKRAARKAAASDTSESTTGA